MLALLRAVVSSRRDVRKVVFDVEVSGMCVSDLARPTQHPRTKPRAPRRAARKAYRLIHVSHHVVASRPTTVQKIVNTDPSLHNSSGCQSRFVCLNSKKNTKTNGFALLAQRGYHTADLSYCACHCRCRGKRVEV